MPAQGFSIRRLVLSILFLLRHVAARDSSTGLPLRCRKRCSGKDCLSACEDCESACYDRRCLRGLLRCGFPHLARPYLCNVQYNKSGKCNIPAPRPLLNSSDPGGGGVAPALSPKVDPSPHAYATPDAPPGARGGDDFSVSRLGRRRDDIPVIVVIILLFVLGVCVIAWVGKTLLSRYGYGPSEPPPDWRKSGSHMDLKSAELVGLLLQPLHAFTLKELRSATKNFSPANLLGDGGEGPVYKATLPDKTIVAIRLLKDTSHGSMHDFYRDINSVAKINHRNLVSIRGCCVEGGQRWLVFDYYPNGSLQDVIFGQKSAGLTWLQCREIMLGTARGIAHLHHSCEPKVIHKEIHPGNVLLDSNFKAHVADFGFRRAPRELRVRRAYVYMCPIYALMGCLTEKSDVYSMGLMMLAMISGRTPMTPSEGHLSFVEMASAYINDSKLLEFVDPKFQAQYYMSEVVSYVSVAMLCVQQDPTRRPSMLEVVSMLEGSKNMAPPLSRKSGRPPLPRLPKDVPRSLVPY